MVPMYFHMPSLFDTFTMYLGCGIVSILLLLMWIYKSRGQITMVAIITFIIWDVLPVKIRSGKTQQWYDNLDQGIVWNIPEWQNWETTQFLIWAAVIWIVGAIINFILGLRREMEGD